MRISRTVFRCTELRMARSNRTRPLISACAPSLQVRQHEKANVMGSGIVVLCQPPWLIHLLGIEWRIPIRNSIHAIPAYYYVGECLSSSSAIGWIPVEHDCGCVPCV